MTYPKLDWNPPSPTRQLANEPYGFFRQAVEPRSRVNTALVPRSRSYTRYAYLDQGQQGACTGFGAAHCLAHGRKQWPVENEHAFTFYKWAKLNDQWTGEDYEGSSVQGVCAGLKAKSLISGYWWINSPLELKLAIANYGPVLVGTWWYSSMWMPDSAGRVSVSGTRDGGHAYSVGAVNLKTEYSRIDNSWGKYWGSRGSCWIPTEELCRLIFQENGEAALIRKLPKVRPELLPVA